MSCFSIPANFQEATIEEIGKHNKNWDFPVKEVYGSLNPSIFGSGRSDSYIRSIDYNSLEKYVAACKKNEIDFNYTLNFTCDSNLEFRPHGKRKVIKFLRKLNSLGVGRFTTALPSILDLLNEYVPDAKVSISVVSDVDSLIRLNAFQASSVQRIMLPEFMNRKLARLERLIAQGRRVGVNFGTIVNSTCLIDCPFRNFHYIFSSHKSGGKLYHPVDYWATRCTLTKINDPVEILKMGWIRPEDIDYYAKMGIDVFKIAGREMKKANFIKTVDIYNQRSFDGNLWELLKCFSNPTTSPSELAYSRMFDIPNKQLGPFTRRFFEAKAFCNGKDCEVCKYCETNKNLVHVNKPDQWKEQLEKERTSFIKDETKVDVLKIARSIINV